MELATAGKIIALVTGVSNGIGFEVVRQMAQRSATVVLTAVIRRPLSAGFTVVRVGTIPHGYAGTH